MLRYAPPRGLLAWTVIAVALGAVLAWNGSALVPPVAASEFSLEVRSAAGATAPVVSATPARPSLAASEDPTAVWTQLSPPLMPPQRIAGAMVWDSTDGYILLFGGQEYGSLPNVLYNDTWSFLHGVWTNRTNPGDAPPARDDFQMADDPSEDEVVVFGGFSQKNTVLDDTWTYSDDVWTNITATAGAPPPTFDGAMAYDNATDSVILFGGEHTAGGAYTNETWQLHDNVWTELAPGVLPPARGNPSITYDPEVGDLILFGGANDTVDFNDTWAFTGTTWTLLTPAFSPDERWGAGIAYDPAQDAVVLYGGSPANTYPFDTFTYAAGTWTLYDTAEASPGQTLGVVQMAYDYSDHYAVLFQDTFTYVNSTWTLSFTSAPPPPALSVSATAIPTSGTIPFQVEFTSEVSGGSPPYSVTWNFGDSSPEDTGSPATAGNTSHTYDSVGSFNATVTVVDSADNSVTKNWTIDASAPALTLSVQATPTTVVVNGTVTFTATPGGGVPPYTYSWSFGDQATSTLEDPTHAYAAVGKYTAQLVVTDHDGSTISRTATVTVTAKSSGASPASSSSWIYVAVAVIVVILAVLLILLTRRRRREPPPAPPPAGSGAGGPSS